VEVNKYAGANLTISKSEFLGMYIKARHVITSRAAAKAFKDVGIDSEICRETVLHRMPTFQRDSTPPPTQPLPEDTPTPFDTCRGKADNDAVLPVFCAASGADGSHHLIHST